MEIIRPRILKGTRDFMPNQMIYRDFVVSKLKTVFEKYGYEPLATPAIEYFDVLSGKYGEEVEMLLYRLAYRDGRTIALRYDLTVPLSRVVAMNPDIVKPIFKRYQIQPVWRAEKPQKGRYREFTQCDVDAVGSTSILVDAEIIAIINEMMASLGFKNFEIKINNRKILDGITEYAGVSDSSKVVCRCIDKLEKIGVERVKDELEENEIPTDAIDKIFTILDITGDKETTLNALEGRLDGFESALQGIDELRQINNALKCLGVPDANYSFDICLARGLDYYTGPIFEVVVKEASIGSVVGGGRWDTLIGQFTGKDVPAVGTSFGLERLIDAMDMLSLLPPIQTKIQALVAPFNSDLTMQALDCVSQLRMGDINAEIYFEPDSMRNTMGYASRKGIPIVIIVAPDELSEGKVAIRNMQTKKQEKIEITNFVARVREILADKSV
ncbi:histidine--tRNA ligase [bacterium]|nr:histidine--tRNA ligase [bacterium]